jgi:putative SOS response-associated peptidase YedK
MCGRFSLTATPEQITEAFQLERLPNYETRYNIPPCQKILAVVRLDDGRHKAVNLFWGLIPPWAKDPGIGHRLINARAETVAEKPSFRTAFQRKRCLIPANGFYEWAKTDQGKQAHHIHRIDDGLFAFAGLWEHWEKDAETLYSCSIITTAANALIQPIHERMPVIIGKQHYDDWLDKQQPPDRLQALLAHDAYQKMAVTPVSDWVNNPVHDDKRCIAAVS